MNSINTARDFFINQQGLSPDQADMIIGQGLQAYNEQTQPKSMMQMASGGIARLGYQMGGSPVGVQAMPMDYGQSLQVNNQGQMPIPNYSSAQNITMNPLLNYGQTPLANGGGIPLTMRGGGIARLGYESGGVTMPSQGSEMEQMNQMDPQQALEIIIKILIENGIPPEQAQQLAQQLLQIFMQGGEPALQKFAEQIDQQETQAMASGGIAGYAQRQGYLLGGIGRAIGSVAKGIGSAVKSVVSSPIGKAALAAAAIYYAPSLFGSSWLGTAPTLIGGTEVGGTLGVLGNLGVTGGFGAAPTLAGLGSFAKSTLMNPFSLATNALNLGSGDNKFGIGTLLGVGGAGAALGSLLGSKKPEETDEQYKQRLQSAGPYLEQYYKNLNPQATPQQISEFVKLNTAEYGGLGQGNTFAKGGIIPPARQIEGGVIELDARKSGGYIPYGKKERLDDVPAMLAKDEFVFTSRAVKGAGGGDARLGAKKMYALMKQLEAKGART